MDINEIFRRAVEKGASDVFIVAGLAISFKIDGVIQPQGEDKLSANELEEIVNLVYTAAGRDIQAFMGAGDDDFSFALDGVGRFRVNAYKQRGSCAMVVRVVRFTLPEPTQLGIPDAVIDLYKKTKGLVLITGPAGSGKSTTLACILDQINKTRKGHIITLEDPIEFIHRHNQSIVSQREIGIDTESYVQGLRAALRESPDVILLGEMRDFETISIAMTAAETGQLVFGTLHTLGAAKTIDRIIDVFPPNQQQQIRVQLAMVLQGVVSQQLIPTEEGLRPAFEIMSANSAIRNMIREAKVHQIDSMIYSYADEGMKGMDTSLLELYKMGRISKEEAVFYSINPESLAKKVDRRG